MHTHTHMLMGIALCRAGLAENTLEGLAIVAGSIAPDLVMVPPFLWDKLKGRQPLANQTETLLRLKDVSHSLLVWALSAILASIIGAKALTLFALAMILHIIVDILTHNSKVLGEFDPGMLWPLKFHAPQALGIWDYRYAHGVLKPKPFEACCDIMLLAFIILI